MRLWTIQGIEIYHQLQSEGIAYCTKPSWGDDAEFMRAYRWMSAQMKQRIGEPPIEGIEFPIWAWYQYESAKKKRPLRSPLDISEGVSAYMEIEVPDNDVLLSSFTNWHCALNGYPLDNWKQIERKTDQLDKAAGERLEFNEYPAEIQREIEASWEPIFDLDRRDRNVGRTHRRNRSIQATFWMLRQEYLRSVEFLERKGNVVKQIDREQILKAKSQ